MLTRNLGSTVTACVVALLGLITAPAQALPRGTSASPRLRESVIGARERSTDQHGIVVGLELRNRSDLEQFLADVQNPASPSYGSFLTQDEFNARYGPEPDTERRVVDYLQSNGLAVTERFPNRLLIGASGSVAALQRAFNIEFHDVTFRGEAHYAALGEPTWPAHIADNVVGVLGLDDLTPMHAHVRATPYASLGSNCCHLSPNDLSRFYNQSSGYTGAGETVVIAGVYAWLDADVTLFNSQWGLPALPSGSGQVCTGSSASRGCTVSRQNSIEISLDVEYAHATAPEAVILNYMAASTASSALTKVYNRIVSDNPGHIVSTSWGSCEAQTSTATQQTNDNIFANANAIGQTWFAASGDNGSLDCGTVLSVDHPANSPHVMGSGGTHPTCSSGLDMTNPACAGYGSERAWSDSGGGISQVFARPAFQTGCAVPAGTQRLVPDVAFEGDPSPGNYVAFGGSWYVIGGTSDAPPQWAGLFAQLNQFKGGSGLGNGGALLYKLCGTAALHDVTTGSNGDYDAGVGYDMVTGLGSPNAAELVALSAPPTPTRTVTGTPPTPTPSATATPTPQCVSVTQPKLTIGKLQTPPGDDTLSFQGKLTMPFPFNPTLDPLTNGVQILIQDAAGSVLDAAIPGGAFSNPPLISGINRVVIQNKSASTPGLVSFTVKGKKGSYAVAPGDLPLTARIVLAPAGHECGDATFPSCTFNASGSTLKCK
jgi:subtilase family serine protease